MTYSRKKKNKNYLWSGVMKYKIAAIIVTFNRKDLLALCLDSIERQEYKPTVAYIIDNASIDGTEDWIRANGYNGKKSGIEFRYVQLPENIGGSGGFYIGLKTAYEAEDRFDAFWLLDDDGIPDSHQLEKLQERLRVRDYLSPLVVAKEDQSRISFGAKPKIQDFLNEKGVKNGLVDNVAFPFNGVLYSRKLVEQVGYPIKEMFIWGDEVNYNLRCVNNGFVPAVVVDAIHVHPADRQQQEVILRNRKIVVPAQDWKLYCYIRNTIYNIRTLNLFRHPLWHIMQLVFNYFVYFTFNSFNWKRLGIVYRAMWDGSRKDLSRLGEYRK